MINVLLKPVGRGRSYEPTDTSGWMWIGQFAKVRDARAFGRKNRCRGIVRYRKIVN